MTIPWDKLFELLFQLLEDCGDDSQSRLEAIQNRPVAVFFAVTRSLRQLEFSGRNLRQARVEVMKEIDDASQEELTAFAEGGPTALLSLR